MAINSLSSSSYGLSGLVSGMDTQSMVEKMLSGTQAKIDNKLQQKTVLQYKQGMYRDVMSQLKTFQNKFMSYTGSSTNLYSNSFYNSMSAKINSATGQYASYNVTASSNAKAGTTTVEYVKQLATATSYKTNFKASSAVEGALNQGSAKTLLNQYYTATGTGDAETVMSINVGGKIVRIENAPMTFSGMSETEVAAHINTLLSNANAGATAKYEGGKLTITANDPKAAISIYGNTEKSTSVLPLKMFGDTNAYLSGTGSFSAAINTSNYEPSFTVNLDGRSQNITLDLALLKNYADATSAADIATAQEAMVNDINDKLKSVYGTGVKAEFVNGGISLSSGSASSNFKVTGNSYVMGTLGLTSGMSNKINTSLALKDLNFAAPLQGGRYTFSINGVDFAYSETTTLSTIINDINNSKAGVTVSYVESQDYFVIANANTGVGYNDIEMKNMEGNFLTALFGEPGGSTVTTSAVSKDITGTAGSATSETVASAYKSGGVFSFNVDGKLYKYTIEPKNGDQEYTAQEFADKLNQQFANSFGYLSDGTKAIEFLYDDTSESFRIVTNDDDRIVKTVDYDKNTNMSLLGFAEGAVTRVTSGNTTLASAGIDFGNATIQVKVGNEELTIDASTYNDATSFADVASDIQAKLIEAYEDHIDAQTGLTAAEKTALKAKAANTTVVFDSATSAFKISGMEEYAASISVKRDAGTDTSSNMDKLFGSESVTLNDGGTAKEILTKAQNAIVSINGIEIERNTNSFEYDGLSFTLTSESKFTYETDSNGDPILDVDGNKIKKNPIDEPTQIVVTRDTQKILDGLKEFIEEYNTMITSFYEMYQADVTYKDYAPLTDAQKAEMSEKEIENWEIKAKEGLLRSDNSLYKIMSAMRSAMYSKADGGSLAIYDLGMSTSHYLSDGNFSMPNESDLLAIIEKDPDGIQQLFAGNGGIMERLNTAINEAVRNQGSASGYLTMVAGANDLDSDASLNKQIKNIDNQLTSLESRYWSEYNRYWSQFNKMEQLIQQMNTQSSWMSQQLGG